MDQPRRGEANQPVYGNTELILRDVLAIDRTILANERTLLAYLRTTLALLAGGGSLVHFVAAQWAQLTGLLLVVQGQFCLRSVYGGSDE